MSENKLIPNFATMNSWRAKEIAQIAINDPNTVERMNSHLETIGRNIAEFVFTGRFDKHTVLTASIDIVEHLQPTQIRAIKYLMEPVSNFKTVIKLDKNFHIYKHTSNEHIERHWDNDRKKFYYKIFYNEEG